jgi:hypothetical protein
MKMLRRKVICSFALALLLSGCAAGAACPPQPAKIAVRNWPKTDEVELVREVNATPPDSMIRVLRDDWETMRRALR